MQQALDALEWGSGTYDRRNAAIAALHQALAEPDQEPQTTHWEGCEAVHPECRKPEQEPVAWAVYDILHGGSKTLHWPEQHSPNGDPKQYKAVPLYTTPTPGKPLTDEALHQVIRAGNYDSMEQFARAIEAAHGIGEQHE